MVEKIGYDTKEISLTYHWHEYHHKKKLKHLKGKGWVFDKEYFLYTMNGEPYATKLYLTNLSHVCTGSSIFYVLHI